MKKQLISIVMTSSLLAAATGTVYAGEQDSGDSKNRQYIGTGLGAVAGALIAGPVGFITGGLIGNLAGRQDDASLKAQELPVANHTMLSSTGSPSLTESAENKATTDSIVVAQSRALDTILDEENDDPASALKSVLIDEMKLDVFFLSGSTTVEAYYQQRIKMISNLLQQMPDIHVYLDGYSDRRGDSAGG